MISSHILPPIAILCIFMEAIQQVRHLKKATKRTKRKLEETNRKWHKKQRVQSKKSCPAQKFFYVLFSVTQYLFLLSFSWSPDNITPPGMRRRSDVSFRSHIGWDVSDHAKTSSRRRNWYVNETDLFETSLQRLTGTWIKPTNLRHRSDVPTGT